MRSVTVPEWVIEKAEKPYSDSRTFCEEDFFRDLCREEIDMLCDALDVTPLNRFLLILHCYGLRDKEIAARLRQCLPLFSMKEGLSADAIRMRRNRLIEDVQASEFAEDVGLITLLHEVFKK